MHQHARQPLRWERRIRSEAPLFVGTVTLALFLVYGNAWLADPTQLVERGVLFVWLLTAIALLHLRRRPPRRCVGRAARRAARHAHPHHLGDRHRGIADRRRHARRRHRPDAGARHDVRRHHDHDERHGRPLPAVGRTAARAAGVQPRRRARLSGRAHPAIRHRADPAEPHGVDGARRARSTSGRRCCSPSRRSCSTPSSWRCRRCAIAASSRSRDNGEALRSAAARADARRRAPEHRRARRPPAAHHGADRRARRIPRGDGRAGHPHARRADFGRRHAHRGADPGAGEHHGDARRRWPTSCSARSTCAWARRCRPSR